MPTKVWQLVKKIDHQLGIATTLYTIGGIYHDQENFEKASDYYDQSLKISEDVKDSMSIAKCLNAIGYLHDDHGHYEEAIEFHERCLMLRTALRDRAGMSWTYNNLARVYYHQEKYEKSVSLYKRSISIKKEFREFTLSETHGKKEINNRLGCLKTYNRLIRNVLAFSQMTVSTSLQMVIKINLEEKKTKNSRQRR